MKPWKYPDEVATYIANHVSGATTRQLTADLNREFSEKYNMVFTEAAIKSYKHNHHMKSGTRCGKKAGFSLKYGSELLKFVQENAKGKTNKELAEMVNKVFGLDFTKEKMNSFKKNHNIVSGLDFKFKRGHIPPNKGRKGYCAPGCEKGWFKPGTKPPNHLEVGQYTHTTDGYLIQKVQEGGIQRERFEFVHRAVWEKYNGPVPDGKMVSFLDGNKDNCSIENLTLIDNEINLEMNRKRMRFEDPELTRVGVKIAEVSVAIRKRGRKVERIRAEQKENCSIQKPEQ